MRAVFERVDIPTEQPLLSLFVYILILATAGVIINVPSALGEEVGWRGLLVPELARLVSPERVALIGGLVWAAWHLPAVWFADYGTSGAPRWFGTICFTALAVGVSFLCTWLRLRSGSVWPAVLLHASHNVIIQAVLTPLTADTGPTPYLIDEFGLVTVAMVWVAVAFLWRRDRDLLWPIVEEQATM